MSVSLADSCAAPVVDDDAFAAWTTDLDADIVADILARFLPECAKCVAEIETALAAGHASDIQARAHKLVGLAGNLGASRLSAVAKFVELEPPPHEMSQRQAGILRSVLHQTEREISQRTAGLSADVIG